MKAYRYVILVCLLNCSQSIYALKFTLPLLGNELGSKQTVTLQAKETLAQIARRFDVGMGELLAANPRVDSKPLAVGQVLQIPSQFTLPAIREGIVVDLSMMRVFYFSKGSTEVSTYPIAVGKKGWDTPRGSTTVISKVANPTWHIPESIWQEAYERGQELPDSIPPGPKNPLGKFAIHLGFSGIMLHGTNAPATVGLSRSHGCMRMYPEDIQDLFEKVAVGTPVNIID